MKRTLDYALTVVKGKLLSSIGPCQIGVRRDPLFSFDVYLFGGNKPFFGHAMPIYAIKMKGCYQSFIPDNWAHDSHESYYVTAKKADFSRSFFRVARSAHRQ
jgi:hypothetical protein